MVIDDELDVLFVLKKALSDTNFNVDTFRDPVEAMNRFHQMNRPYYDLVITDIRMPKVNGLEPLPKHEVDRSERQSPFHICT